MNPEQKKQAILGVLAAVVLGAVIWQFVLKTPAGTGITVSQSTGGKLDLDAVKKILDELTNVDLLLSDIDVVNFIYENEKIDRNPMTVVPMVIKAPPGIDEGIIIEGAKIRSVFEMRITGILYNEYRPMAIVDDQLVSVGHTYGNGVRIVQIDRDRVWFDVDDARVPRELKEL